MKWLTGASLIFISLAGWTQSEIHCDSTDGKYRIEVIHANNIADKITYFKNGEFFREFSNVPVMEERVDILFSKTDVMRFTVGFQNFRYFEIDRKISKGVVAKIGKGAFIPRNFPLSAEYELKCLFEE